MPLSACILFALRRESQHFRRLVRPYQRLASPCWSHLCGAPAHPILLVETGVGAARMAAALDWLLTTRPPRLICAGFAGSLTADLTVGSVVWASSVCDEHGHSFPATWAPAPPLPTGRLLTFPRLVTTPADKQALAQRHQASAVDMESAVFARRCTEAGIPFACVRAISDDVATALSPEVEHLLSKGAVSPWRLTTTLLRRPRLVTELLRLARDTNLASRRLGQSLAELLGNPHRSPQR
jgi:nucleoside phosphorylase